jgi:putative ABC transport system permease protein
MLAELGSLAINNLLRARARLVMTAGGVLVGTTAVILLIALTLGLQQAAEASIGNNASLTEIEVYTNYGMGPNGQTPENIPQLTPKAIEAFWKIPGVAAVIPTTRLMGGEAVAGKLSGYVDTIGIDARLLPYLRISVVEGDLILERGQVLVGTNAGDYFSDPKATGDSYQTVPVDLFNTPFRIKLYPYDGSGNQRVISVKASGKLASNDRFNYSILMPIQDVISFNEWVTGTKIDPKTFVYDQVIIRSSTRETTNQVSEAIREMGYQAGGMGEYLNQLNSFFSTLRLMLGGVGGVALLVAAFGVANTMTMAILERTKEIGLMKAIGATDRDVLTIFLIEAGLVGLVGGIAGVGLSYFLQNIINNALSAASQNTDPGAANPGIGFLPFDTSQIGGNLLVISPELSLFALLLATGVGLVAGLYPSLRAARMTPVIALKSE